MGTTLTTNYSLIKPNIFEEFDSWGTHYNDTMDLIDAALTTIAANATSAKTKTDFITITQAVDLDTVESNANTAFGWGDHASAGYATTAAVAAGYQPLDADLTAIAALTTAAYGRSLLEVASEAALHALINLEIGTDVQAYDADTLKADTADQLTAAFTEALDDDGTQSSGTYTPSVAAGSNSKAIVNNGAFTLAPPSPSSGEVIHLTMFITNGASAGAITTSGFTKVTGDSFDTTNGNDFLCRIEVVDKAGTKWSHLDVVALQ